MADLGFDRFGAQGGDWGSVVTANVADLVAGSCGRAAPQLRDGARRPKDGPPLTEAEQADFARLLEWRKDGAGYQEIQGTRPQTLGYGLAGLAGRAVRVDRREVPRVVRRRRRRARFARDRLLDNITLYWVTGTAASSCRIYWEMRQAGRNAMPQDFIDVPTGIANFPAEITEGPACAGSSGGTDVVHWTEPPRGGHFAAMEVPDLFVDDVRTFFRSLR